MTKEMRKELMELILNYGSACEKFGEEITNYWADEEQNYLEKIEELLDKLTKV